MTESINNRLKEWALKAQNNEQVDWDKYKLIRNIVANQTPYESNVSTGGGNISHRFRTEQPLRLNNTEKSLFQRQFAVDRIDINSVDCSGSTLVIHARKRI